MPYYRVGGLMVHIKMTNTKKRPAPAPCCAKVSRSVFLGHESDEGKPVRCMGISTYLCDWPVDEGRATCDAPLCEEHAGLIAPDTNLCPVHLALHRADHPELG